MKNLLFLIVVFIFLTACSNFDEKLHNTQQQDSNKNTVHNHLSGDLQEITSSINQLPRFLDGQTEDIRLVYEASGKAHEILQWIPCYCGCGESAGHKNNLQCFIAEIREDGSVVWDDHGTRCIVCLEIAAKSILLYQEGKSLNEIRQIIDDTYKEGFAEPTPTQLPV